MDFTSVNNEETKDLMPLNEFLCWANQVFHNEGLEGWKIVTDKSDAYCWYNQKTITLKPQQCYPALLLHEVAHALAYQPERVGVVITPRTLFVWPWWGLNKYRYCLVRLGGQQYHGGHWADRYGELVRKYLVLPAR
jgi:hypothetical protein